MPTIQTLDDRICAKARHELERDIARAKDAYLAAVPEAQRVRVTVTEIFEKDEALGIGSLFYRLGRVLGERLAMQREDEARDSFIREVVSLQQQVNALVELRDVED